MKGISLINKYKVIKLFFTGISYDGIAQQVGIAKGSVVNIINEFRDGNLQVPSGMTEYADSLRQVAVDLRKNNTSIAQVESCIKLDAKLKEMGASGEKAEHWLDICASIASPTVSTDQFVNAALELSDMTSESGVSYRDLLNDYKDKSSRTRELSEEIKQEEQQLNEARTKHREDKEQATKELDAVTKAITTAQDTFRKQKDDLRARIDKYLVQNKLSWKKINTVVAMLNAELGKAGLPKIGIENLSERIYRAGSLVNVSRQLEKEKEKLQAEVDGLVQKEQSLADKVNKLKSIDDNLQSSISQNKQKLDRLNNELNSKLLELEELKQNTCKLTQNLYVAHLIIDFLFAPENINDYDLDRLVGLFISLRQKRLGIGPKQVKDYNGNVVCECQIPKIHSSITIDESNIDNVRGIFAHLLTPLVKDKFISRFDYDMAELTHKTEVLKAVIEERNRHII